MHNAQLTQQSKSDFKRTISVKGQNQYLDYLADPSFHWVNKLFVLLFEDNVHRTRYKKDFFPTIEMKYYSIMI